jgi:hypothetical protein
MPDPEGPAEFTSDEQREAHIEALKVELLHLEQTGQPDRAEEVKGHLKRLAGRPAQKRVRGAEAETR